MSDEKRELTQEDLNQLKIMDRLRRMSEMHAYSRGLLGFSPVPFRTRARDFIQNFNARPQTNPQRNPNSDANLANSTRVIERFPRPFMSFIERFRQPQQNPMSEEDGVVQEELRQQTLEAAKKRKEKEQAELEEKEGRELLEKAKRDIAWYTG